MKSCFIISESYKQISLKAEKIVKMLFYKIYKVFYTANSVFHLSKTGFKIFVISNQRKEFRQRKS